MVVLTPDDRSHAAAEYPSVDHDADDVERTLAIMQGVGFAATGIWPLVHMRSFMAVTGPKTDDWLVRTVGALVTVIGGVLAVAGLSRRLTPEMRALAGASSASLAAIDVVYASRGRISKIYLLDAAVEVPLAAFWLRSLVAPRVAADSPDDGAARQP